ncbi:hypothetical protein BB560_007069, partial [Smittium megazygosporum]
TEKIPGIIGDKKYAYELYLKSAKLGYIPSIKRLAEAYEYGELGLDNDPVKSVLWYTRGAQKNDAESAYALGIWYFTGAPPNIPQDDRLAFKWVKRAAERKLPKAMCFLGYLSEFGIGAKMDMRIARFWYLQASSSGFTEAYERLERIDSVGTSKGIKFSDIS